MGQSCTTCTGYKPSDNDEVWGDDKFGFSRSTPLASCERVVDTNLYSRQIAALGMDTMEKLVNMKVLVSGLRGLGAEVAKNLVLAGPAALILHDDAIVMARDLGANFLLSETDIGHKSRAQACLAHVSELNPRVSVSVHAGPITKHVLSLCSVAVFSEASHGDLLRWGDMCRALSPPIGFIAADTLGLAGGVFVDFGDNFECLDRDGEEPRSAIVAGITQENPGVVHTHHERRHGFQDGDWVIFREIRGMTELNRSEPRQIKVMGPYSFSIEDTTLYSAYEREGTVTQVKVPHALKFSSYRDCFEVYSVAPALLPVPDLTKIGRAEQLHLAMQAVRRFRSTSRDFLDRDAGVAEACFRLAIEGNDAVRKARGGLTVEKVDEKVIKNVSNFAQCSISPVASFLGGIVAQEVLKYTGKYTPLQQCFYFDMFELLPDTEPTDWHPIGSRYDDQIAIFGQSFQKLLADLKLFLVGAGALGCEILKSIAMMGAACGNPGKVTVTDMDQVEFSNLGRQFLFRQSDVGKPKATTAASCVKRVLNSELNIEAQDLRVGTDTEDNFDDDFWEALDCVVTALDNTQARTYIDSRCVWFSKPLLESGTLGPKANVQVVLPHLTQSYGDSQDPPDESIPLCTLKHFPHAIEHTIEWARALFQQLFVDAPRDANVFLVDPTAYLAQAQKDGVTAGSQLSVLVSLRRALDARASGTFQSCVGLAVQEFNEKFNDIVMQLLTSFPIEHMTGEGVPFWSGPKRAPTPMVFDARDALHVDFVLTAANLYASIFGLKQCHDRGHAAELAAEVRIATSSTTEARSRQIIVNENDSTIRAEGDDDETKLKELADELRARCAGDAEPLLPAVFEKEDDSSYHLRFIASAANLRARNYKIPEADFQKAKMTAGRIVPALVTSTATIVGLICVELLQLARGRRAVNGFKNAFVNLALPLFITSEPMPPLEIRSKDFDPVIRAPVRAKPERFTTWDKIDIKLCDATLGDFLKLLLQDYGAEATIVSAGNACLYNAFVPAHRKRTKELVSKIWQEATKQTLSEKRSCISIEVSATDPDDGVDVQLPTIKFHLR